jgi:hypothetical protein
MGPVGYLLIAVGAYLVLGLGFAVAFVVRGVGIVDPVAADASWAWRILIMPGTAALWPLMLKKWVGVRRGGST